MTDEQIAALGRAEGPETLDQLISLLDADGLELSQSDALMLALAARSDAQPELLRRLGESGGWANNVIARALARLERPPVESLIPQLPKLDPEAQIDVAHAMAVTGDDRGDALLSALCKREDLGVALYAGARAIELGHLVGLWPTLAAYLEPAYGAAAKQLLQMVPAQMLERAADNLPDDLYREMMDVIGWRSIRSLTGFLRDNVNNPDVLVSQSALVALIRLGDTDAWKTFRERWKGMNTLERFETVWNMLPLHQPLPAQLALVMASDDSVLVSNIAIEIVGFLKERDVEVVLKPLLGRALPGRADRLDLTGWSTFADQDWIDFQLERYDLARRLLPENLRATARELEAEEWLSPHAAIQRRLIELIGQHVLLRLVPRLGEFCRSQSAMVRMAALTNAVAVAGPKAFEHLPDMAQDDNEVVRKVWAIVSQVLKALKP